MSTLYDVYIRLEEGYKTLIGVGDVQSIQLVIANAIVLTKEDMTKLDTENTSEFTKLYAKHKNTLELLDDFARVLTDAQKYQTKQSGNPGDPNDHM